MIFDRTVSYENNSSRRLSLMRPIPDAMLGLPIASRRWALQEPRSLSHAISKPPHTFISPARHLLSSSGWYIKYLQRRSCHGGDSIAKSADDYSPRSLPPTTSCPQRNPWNTAIALSDLFDPTRLHGPGITALMHRWCFHKL